jgi:hypothetical protein
MSKLSERAMLACLHIGCWSGSSHDREVTEEVSERHKADSKDAGRYSKQLISKKALHHVNSVAGVARRTHKLLTLPWEDDGSRILSTIGYQAYTEQMRLKRLAFEAATTQFCEQLPEFINEAKTRLGSMFEAGDYDDVETIRKKFSIDVEIKPVPEAGDFRAALSDQSTKAIVKDIERRTDMRLEQAMKDVFLRVADVTEKMVERLRAYKPGNGEPAQNLFRDSLIYNVQELGGLLPSLNITGDNRLFDLSTKLDALTEHAPEVLREDDKLREQTAAAAEKILKKVRDYMG